MDRETGKKMDRKTEGKAEGKISRLDRIKGNSDAAAGAMGWGISGVCSQYLFSEYQLDSGWLTAVRMILSGILLLGSVFFRDGRQIFGVVKDGRDRLWLLAFAVLVLL